MSSALLESMPTHQMETFSDALDLCYTTSGDENAESAEKQEGAAHTDATPVFFLIAHLACTGCDSSIQQFSIYLLLLLHSGSQGGWGGPSQLSLGEGGASPWTSPQFITRTNSHSHSHSYLRPFYSSQYA